MSKLFFFLNQVAQCGVCLYLGYQVNINEVHYHSRANNGTQICIMLNVLTIVINILISSFDINLKF